MSQPTEKEIIHKEFELERIILFSDAVFAIAITLLVIDVKFPELPEDFKNHNQWHLFRPTVIKFLSFCLSFFFIGNFWLRHLKLFKLLRQYNHGLVVRNLMQLFFIVLFPFAAETMAANIRPDFPLPLILYIFNIAFCSLMHTLLCHYIFYKHPHLALPGHENEKRYLYIRSKYATIMIGTVAIIALIVVFVFPGDMLKLAMSFYVLPFVAFLVHRKTKHLKPVEPAH